LKRVERGLRTRFSDERIPKTRPEAAFHRLVFLFPLLVVGSTLPRMTHHEAYVEKGWEEMGLAHLFVSRIREDGSSDFAMFLVDVFCLGVKDASFEADVSER